jgi:hypothetical protein
VGLGWSPGSDLLSFRHRALYTLTPGSGFPPTAISVSPTIVGVVVSSYAWAPDGSRIAYRANPNGPFEVFATYPDTSIGTVLLSPSSEIAQGTTEAPKWTPDSSHVIHRMDAAALGVYELFAAAADGSSIPRLSGPLVRGGQVSRFTPR